MPEFAVVVDAAEFVLVDKSAGVSVHRDEQEQGVLERIRAELGIPDLLPVHRLDKVTSGLWLLARGREWAAYFGEQFRDHAIQKFYVAISDKKPKKKQGRIAGDMAKGRGGSWMLNRTQANPAVTQFFSHSLGEGRRLFLLRPMTGRTHQLRVALKSLGAPILGDTRYGGTSADRTYLHACGLRFQLPDREVAIWYPPCNGAAYLDSACTDQLKVWSEPWLLNWPAR